MEITKKDILIFELDDEDREAYLLFQIPNDAIVPKNIGKIYQKGYEKENKYEIRFESGYCFTIEDMNKILDIFKKITNKKK